MAVLSRMAMLGLGEVGEILATDLQAGGQEDIVAWDILFRESASRPAEAVTRLGLTAGAGPVESVAGCGLVISAVTAGQALAAAESVLEGLAPGTWYLDLNSVAPETKRAIGARVEAAGARFVEAAVMSPIGPRRIATSMLLAGEQAEAFLLSGRALGFTGMKFCSTTLGQAAATKMCRSVVVKGMEALLSESLLAARHYGVEQAVLDSLKDLFPRDDWPAHAHYMIGRTLQHGTRRAEEMQEAAATVAGAGLEPWMSRATVERQAWAGSLPVALDTENLVDLLDAVRAELDRTLQGTVS